MKKTNLLYLVRLLGDDANCLDIALQKHPKRGMCNSRRTQTAIVRKMIINSHPPSTISCSTISTCPVELQHSGVTFVILQLSNYCMRMQGLFLSHLGEMPAARERVNCHSFDLHCVLGVVFIQRIREPLLISRIATVIMRLLHRSNRLQRLHNSKSICSNSCKQIMDVPLLP